MTNSPNEPRGQSSSRRPIGSNIQTHPNSLDHRDASSVEYWGSTMSQNPSSTPLLLRPLGFQDSSQTRRVAFQDTSINPQGGDPDSEVEESSSDHISAFVEGANPEINTSWAVPSQRRDRCEAMEHTFHAGTDAAANTSSSLALTQATERAVYLARTCGYIVRTMCDSFLASKPWLELVSSSSDAWVYIDSAAASCHTLKGRFSTLLDLLSPLAHEDHQCAPEGLCAHNSWHISHARKLTRLTHSLECFIGDFSRVGVQTPRTYTLRELADALVRSVACFRTHKYDIKRSWLKLEQSVTKAALKESDARVPSAEAALDKAADDARAVAAAAHAAATARDTAQAALNALRRQQDELRLHQAEIERRMKAIQREASPV
ncbi:hypothetical protein C8R45DRAFT_277302 [Mycena sanguinolenta]|nr:hypothetical protein C8R45DRAFT_277302 [Mycena sanguinolenta]